MHHFDAASCNYHQGPHILAKLLNSQPPNTVMFPTMLRQLYATETGASFYKDTVSLLLMGCTHKLIGLPIFFYIINFLCLFLCCVYISLWYMPYYVLPTTSCSLLKMIRIDIYWCTNLAVSHAGQPLFVYIFVPSSLCFCK